MAMFLKVGQQPEMFKTSIRSLSRLADLIFIGQERGDIRKDIGPPLAAQQLFATYYWGLTVWLGSGAVDRKFLSTMNRMSLDLLMQGLSTR